MQTSVRNAIEISCVHKSSVRKKVTLIAEVLLLHHSNLAEIWGHWIKESKYQRAIEYVSTICIHIMYDWECGHCWLGTCQALSLHKSYQNNNEIGYNAITTTTATHLSTACGLQHQLSTLRSNSISLSLTPYSHRHIVSIAHKFDSISALNI